MPDMPISSSLSYVGVLALVFGLFLILTGLGVIQIQQVTVVKGKRTLLIGVFFLFLGGAFLLPELFVSTSGISTKIQEPPASSPTQQEQPTRVETSSMEGQLLVYEESFEDGIANGWDGYMEVVQLEDGNHVWRTEDGEPGFSLPEGMLDYGVEARIMQTTGSGGAAGIAVRLEPNEPCDAGYLTYIDFTEDWLNLVEKEPTCEENRGEDGLFGAYKIDFFMGTWYTLRIEARGEKISVYIDGVVVGSDEDESYKSNRIALWACCPDSGVHQFYFDDIRIRDLR